MSSGLVGDRELTQISSYHIELDFDVVERFSAIHSHVVSDHFRHDDCVSEVSFDWSWFFSGLGVLLGLLALAVKTDVFVLDFWIER